MTSADILRSGRQPMDLTLPLESKDALGRVLHHQAESYHLHVLVIVRNKDEWLSLKVALLEEDGFYEAMHLRVEIQRSATVFKLQHAITKAYLEIDPVPSHVDVVWRVYLAQEGDGSWPTYESVQAMTSRELVQSGRQHLPLNDQEALGPGYAQPPEHRIHVLAVASVRRDELDDLLVSVTCAILTTPMINMKCLIHGPVVVTVDVPPTASIQDVELAIKYELSKYRHQKGSQWKLYLAQDYDGNWLTREAIQMIFSGQVEAEHRRALAPQTLLSDEQCFAQTLHAQAGKTRILVDPQVEKVAMSHEKALRAILGTATSIARLPDTLDHADVDQWRSADCGSVKEIHQLVAVFPMLPHEYYVRNETLIVWSEFKKHFQSRFGSATTTNTDRKQFLLAGSPGVGKSSLMVLMCAFIAVKLRCGVVLYVKRYDFCSTVWYLAGEDREVFTWEDPQLQDPWKEELIRGRVDELVSTVRKVTGNVWICTDGLTYFEMKTQLQGLHIDLAVLPFPRCVIPYTQVRNVQKCLLACWLEADLMALGKLRGMSEDERKARYYVSGGIVAWFVGDIAKAKQIIRRAVARLVTVDKRGIAPRLCQSSCDEIFTLMLPVDDCEEEFGTEIRWHREVTSAFAQTLLPEGYHFRLL